MKKLLTLLLVVAILLPCFLTGCDNLFGKTPTETTPEATTPEVTTPEVTTPEQTTPEVTTPEATTPEEPPVITPPEVKKMTLTTVNVTTGTDVTEIFAGTELISYLNKKGISSSAEGFPIHIMIDSSLSEGCFTVEASLEENAGMTGKGYGRWNSAVTDLQRKQILHLSAGSMMKI